MIQIKSKPKVK